MLSIPFCIDKAETSDMETWRDRARRHMKDRGITQDQLAEKLNMTPGGVQKWLAGTREPTLADIFKICELIGAPSVWVIHGMDSNDALEGLSEPARISLRRFIEAERKHRAPPTLWATLNSLADLSLLADVEVNSPARIAPEAQPSVDQMVKDAEQRHTHDKQHRRRVSGQ